MNILSFLRDIFRSVLTQKTVAAFVSVIDKSLEFASVGAILVIARLNSEGIKDLVYAGGNAIVSECLDALQIADG